MGRATHSWTIVCGHCVEIYQLSNFMYKTYIDNDGRKLHADTHRLKHLQEQGKVSKILKRGESE